MMQIRKPMPSSMKQAGFTLIELIAVIVLLGILAMSAAPRFFGLTSAARTASLEALGAQMNSVVYIVYASSIIRGLDAESSLSASAHSNLTQVELAYGYPAATQDGIVAALELSVEDWSWYEESDGSTSSDSSSLSSEVYLFPASLDKKSGKPTRQCYVKYTGLQDRETPQIQIITDEC